VIAASASFCSAFRVEPAALPGRLLSKIGRGEWAIPQLASLLKATAAGAMPIEGYELDLVVMGQKPRSLILNARRIDDGDIDRVRILLAITDVTSARELSRQKDDLLREKAILLQEVQHRVANSLQIIASVLMQSARQVQSEEARGFLRDAHHRVMSIAQVQRQLATSSLGNVALRPYLIQLCESLGASMIQDPSRLSIVAKIDDSVVDANTSVSLGLIVTELVINALKHAFTDNRQGSISVDFRSEGPTWALSVVDDGIGMPTGTEKARPGLGTGIVEALARQLGGKIIVCDAMPGTSVRVVSDQLTLESLEAQPAA
jgi:two-component sensor histidine kinase